MTSSITESITFTITHARQLGSKVATDLKRIQRFYGVPLDADINVFEQEVVALLKAGYLKTVAYGFQTGGVWIAPTLRYSAKDLASATSADDDPGRVPPNLPIGDAKFHSFLEYSSSFFSLSAYAQAEFEKTLPFQRSSGSTPQASGTFTSDRVYSAGGVALDRSILRG